MEIVIESNQSRRVLKNDLMNPVVTDVPLPRPESFVLSSPETTASLLPSISPLTLAYFSDAGWYDVDFSKASPSSGPWGRGAGCPFVNEKCIMANGKVRAANSAFFCNDPRALLPTSNVESSQAPSRSDFDQRVGRCNPCRSLAMKWNGPVAPMIVFERHRATLYAMPNLFLKNFHISLQHPLF